MLKLPTKDLHWDCYWPADCGSWLQIRMSFLPCLYDKERNLEPLTIFSDNIQTVSISVLDGYYIYFLYIT